MEVPALTLAAQLTGERNDADSDDMDLAIDGVEFQPDCDAYYSTPFRLSWDLDGNGDFNDGTDSTVTINGAALDGPSEVRVGARSQSPLGGAVGETRVGIYVRNLPPRITLLELRDSLGLRIGIDVPFAVLGLPLTANGTFTDAGRPDSQDASLDWGDGTTEADELFDGYQDAYGGRVGSFSHTRAYAAAGDYLLTLGVTDDDGGTASAQAFATVLSPSEAVRELVAILDEMIAATASPVVRRALERARQQLAGSVEGLSSNGAFSKLSAELLQAAMQKIRHAIGYLEEAQAAGADVGTEIALLRQVLASLSAT